MEPSPYNHSKGRRGMEPSPYNYGRGRRGTEPPPYNYGKGGGMQEEQRCLYSGVC